MAFNASTRSRDDDAQAIRTLTREFVAGFNSGDVDRIMRFYADRYVDVNLKNQVQTHEERAAYYKRIIDRRDTQVEVTPEEIIVDGDHAVARGTLLVFKLDGQGRRGEPKELRYIEVWEKQPVGWKSIWGIDSEVYPESR
jgi:ketosteroid isomerase-like protein